MNSHARLLKLLDPSIRRAAQMQLSSLRGRSKKGCTFSDLAPKLDR